MPKLLPDEIAAFLDERLKLVRIGTVDDDGTPRVTPTWFIYRDGLAMFTPRQATVLLANVRRDPRVALVIDESETGYRKVNITGRAEVLFDVGNDDAWRDIYRDIARRYIDADAAERYIQATIDQPRALLGVRLADAKVTSWRMPSEDEPSSGIWARRYYSDGTRMARIADGA